jgi:putative ABC transport system permease protein
MRLIETWSIALGALREYRSRAALSTLGVVLGSASIVLVVSVAATARQYVVDQIEGVGANLVYAQRVQRADGDGPAARADDLTMGDLEAVRTEIRDVVDVAGTRDKSATIVAGGQERGIRLIGVTDGFERIRNLTVVKGRYFDDDEMQSGSRVCLLTEDLATRIFPEVDPIGTIARVDTLPLTVIGTFRERVSTFGASEIQPESAVVPNRVLAAATGQDFLRVLYAQATSAAAVPEVTEHVRRLLEVRHRTAAQYAVENLTALLAAAHRISTALTVTLLVVAVIAILISGIGIMNVMLVTVAERTREIGLRKAVGATRASVRSQFLIEAAVIGGGGAVGGIALALIVLALAGLLLPPGMMVQVSGLSIVVALVVSAGAGLLFGFLPASRAANLEAVDALRHE